MPSTNELLRDLQAEVLNGRDLKRCRELVAQLPPATGSAFSIMLGAFDQEPASPAAPVADADRLAACRLALLLVHAHTSTPAWSSALLTRIVKAALSIPGAEPADLFRAMWTLLLEFTPELTSVSAAFIRALALEFLLSHLSRKTELKWLVEADLAVTPIEAFFKFQTLVLRPELYTDDVQAEVLFQLRNDPIAKPYLGRT